MFYAINVATILASNSNYYFVHFEIVVDD